MKEGPDIKQLYDKGINIMGFFRDREQSEENSQDSILYAYDLQAGSYTANYESGQVMERPFLVDGKKVFLSMRDFKRINGRKLADILNKWEFASFLEVGVGEGTTLCDILPFLKEGKERKFFGLDMSLSRLLYAQRFAERKKAVLSLCAGDMFKLPFPDASVDVVFTCHCIEPNTGRESDALKELYRVARRYVIMVEPSYELGNRETRERIEQNHYITGLKEAADKLGLPVSRYRLFEAAVYENNSALLVLEKGVSVGGGMAAEYACPRCGQLLKKHGGNYYCSRCMLIYPVIGGIPILLENQAVLCSKYMEWG